jgi:hypothetical protein
MNSDPWTIGTDHEQSVSDGERSRRGAWYTPRPLIEHLVELAIRPGQPPQFVVDPTSGGGGFLVGALDRLVTLGLAPSDAVGRVGGLDIDPGAVKASRAAVDAWCVRHGVPAAGGRARHFVGDALTEFPSDWPRPDLIIGNPPFSTPLRGREHPSTATSFRQRHADLLGPYADLAAIHLAADLQLLAPGGRVCLVLPQSLLASRDVEGLRRSLSTNCSVTDIWAAREAVFEAGVRVWAPVLDVGIEPAARVRLSSGADPSSNGDTPTAPLAELVAAALGAPAVGLDESATLGEMTTATAGFRDEYYGLAEACVEGHANDHRLRLVTVGALDPLVNSWGEQPMKFAKKHWNRPVINSSKLSDRVARWVGQQARPKLVLPTQSKVFEPVVDRTGSLVPVTPVLSIHGEVADLDSIAAVFLAPPVVAWAHRRWFGAALSVDAIKLAARNVAQLPLPVDRDAWQRAAGLILVAEGAGHDRRQVLLQIGREMNTAYHCSDDVFEWWAGRLRK